MAPETLILSQWYAERGDRSLTKMLPDWYYKAWREALRKYFPGWPILIIHNGGPTDPPYGPGVTIEPAVEMMPHGRGTHGHFANCWRSMAHGIERAMELYGKDVQIFFVGQNLIVGSEDVRKDLANALEYTPVAMNLGCIRPSWAFTEYLGVCAGDVVAAGLTSKRLESSLLLEQAVPEWCGELGLSWTPIPSMKNERDRPFRSWFTYLFHNDPKTAEVFCRDRGLLK